MKYTLRVETFNPTQNPIKQLDSASNGAAVLIKDLINRQLIGLNSKLAIEINTKYFGHTMETTIGVEVLE